METIKVASSHKLAMLVRNRSDKALIIDSRTFCEYNTSHILNSVNVWSSKIRKKRLQQDSISVHDYLHQACQLSMTHVDMDIIVYDQNAPNPHAVPLDSFLNVLLNKLGHAFSSVYLLSGGFLEFQASYPELCEDSSMKCSPLTTQSQPCLPVANIGPTRILPFLYLGSQHDANNRQLLQDYNITYELNVSLSCPKPDFMQDSHFMRIPVNDNFSEKLLPYFNEAFNFIDKVREGGGYVLVHCLAGISRSATVAIAYVMKHLRLSFEEAYMYVKNRRPTISPNINFVGQLAELDRQLRCEYDTRRLEPTTAPVIMRSSHESLHTSSSSITSSSIASTSTSASYMVGRHHKGGMGRPSIPHSLSLNLKSTLEAVPSSPANSSCRSTPLTPPDMSPSTALARLSFASALDDLRDDGRPKFRGSPINPSTPNTCLPPGSPSSDNWKDISSSPVFSFASARRGGATSAPIFSSVYMNKDISSRTINDCKSEAKKVSCNESFISSDSSKSTSESSNFYSSATISVGAAPSARGAESNHREEDIRKTTTANASYTRDRDGRQVSVCVIDVKREDVCNEPLVIRETQVMATPCQVNTDVRSTIQVHLPDRLNNQDKESNITKIPIRKIEDKKIFEDPLRERNCDNVSRLNEDITQKHRREVIVPIQVAGTREGRPKVLELIGQNLPYQPIPATAACSAVFPGKVSYQSESPKEGMVPVSSGNVPDIPGPATGVQQSDSGILMDETPNDSVPASPQRLPRCYSSSETHLNTRKLLEHRGVDFGTRKCSSSDEVGRGWLHNQQQNSQQSQTTPISSSRENSTWICPWELARSDSVSTSGLGSEISDTDLLHDDAHSTTTDDPHGPYDAVFSDVFPGEPIPGNYQHSQHYNEYRQQQQQPTTPKTPRPASLPGVTGAYFTHFEVNCDSEVDMGVDVSSAEGHRGGCSRTHIICEKKDSGYYSFPTEHPPVTPGIMGEGVRHTTTIPICSNEHPRELQLLSNSSSSNTHQQPSQSKVISIMSNKASKPGTPPSIPTTAPSKIDSRSSPEKRVTPEKRKIRGSSTEENEEKRRSCEVESPRHSINLGAGAKRAQELLHGVEHLLESEMTEIRRRTAAISSRIHLLGKNFTNSTGNNNNNSSTKIISSGMKNKQEENSGCIGNSNTNLSRTAKVHTIYVTTTEENFKNPLKVGSAESPYVKSVYSENSSGVVPPGSSRAHSEPPFTGEEGLYRARSCPGLPRSSSNNEGNETVAALVSDLQMVRLRGTSRPTASKDKFLNRYSCGALDAQQQAPNTTTAFESCPDFGNLRPCVREGDSLHSSSSSISSHSSFTRLLQVS
ncbi:unnamed protein product [Meganyctiphanes norvegica]|uniref:protein-tyrosine-phosphatase n=1 Tax=Meganyctiphanes norvegica TaxID=48144 RepID=A0AAV2PPA9_MEGNR